MKEYLDLEYIDGVPSLMREEDIEEYLDLSEYEQIRIQIHLCQYGDYESIYNTLNTTKDLSYFASIEDAFQALFFVQYQKTIANNYLTVDYNQFYKDCLFRVELLDNSYYVVK